MKHKLLSIWLAMLMCMVASVASAYDFSVGGIYYNITSSTDKTVAVTFNGTYWWSVNKYYAGDIVIPNRVTHNGTTYSVTSIGEFAFDSCKDLTSVTIPGSITKIDENAFNGCVGLTSITIPNSVKAIGDYAFGGCGKLMSFTLPKSVDSIGEGIFADCNSLESIVVEEGNTVYNSMNNCNAIIETASCTLIAGCNHTTVPDNIKAIGNGAFQSCTGLSSITIPSSVTSIGSYAFSYCTGLTAITIPSSVTSIGNDAFLKCTGLTAITIPSSVTSIESSAFSGCTGLATITIPSSVQSIGSKAFENCSNLTDVTINSNNIAANTYTSRSTLSDIFGTQVTHYTFGGSVSSIGEYTCYNLTGLETVDFGENVKIIGSGAFRNCKNLTSIEIGCGIASIGSSAFSGCTNLTDVTINSDSIASKNSMSQSPLSGIFGTQVTHYTFGDSVTTIGGYACYNLTGLKTVSFGENVKRVGYNAFGGCTGLTKAEYASMASACRINYEYASTPLLYADMYINGEKVTDVVIPEGVETIGNYAFTYGKITSVTIPASVTNISRNAFVGCSDLTTIVVKNGNTKYDSRNGCNAIIETISNELILGCKNTDIPNTVTYIGDGAFASCTGLAGVSIPSSVATIGARAFYSCTGLTSITIPDNVKTIGSYAFGSCTNLTSVEIGCGVDSIAANEYTTYGSGNSYISSYGAFYGCKSLTDVTINSDNVASRNYYESTLSDVFGTQVTHYTFGDSVTTIGSYACYNLTGIETVSFGKNVKKVGHHAFSGCTGLKKAEYASMASACGINYSYDGHPLAYANLYINGEEVTDVVIPDEVTSLGKFAFAGYNGMTSVSLPNSITSIAGYAFYGCTGLTSLTIPESVTSIGDYAFGNCSGLTSISMPNSLTSIDSNTFNGCTGLTSLAIPESVTSIGYYAFGNCSGLTSISIPDNVKTIGCGAFRDCTNLASVEIGCGVDSIAVNEYTTYYGRTSISSYGAFYGCTSLTDVAINSDSIASKAYTEKSTLADIFGTQVTHYAFGDSVTTIGKYACYNLTGLETVSFGENVKTVGYNAFTGCTGLTKAEYASLRSACSINYSYVGHPLSYANLFVDGEEVTNVVIPEGIDAIGNYAFAGYGRMTSVSLPNSIASIGGYAFNGCTGLTSLTIPESVTSIGVYAFSDCTGLSSITIPVSITSIGGGAFSGCTGLTEVSIPEGITAIEPYTFSGCEGLTSVTIPESVTLIDRGAFNDCIGLTSVVIPEKVDSIGVEGYAITDWSSYSYYVPGAFDGCTNLTDVTINSNSIASKTYTSKTTLAKVFGTQVTHYTFGDSVKAIGNYACYGLETLDSITLGNNLRSIGDYAFKGCEALTSISFPDSLQIIGRGAFSGCSDLTSVSFGESVTSVGFSAFEDCDDLNKAEFASLESLLGIDFSISFSRWGNDFSSNPLDYATLYINGEPVTDIVVPETVTSIGSGVFAGYSGLKSIIMGDNVKSIGFGAFAYCSNLDSVAIGNNVKTIGSDAFANCSRISSITIGNNVAFIGSDAFYKCSGLKDVTINSDSIASKSYYNAYSIKGLSNIFGTQVTHYTFGGAVRAIGDYACYNLENLKAVTIGDSVKAVGEYAFRSTGLEKTEFESIGSLCDIEFANESSNPLYWAQHLFVNGEELTEVVIPEGVTAIKKYAFIDCVGLTSLSIPESVTSIGEGAFYYCTGLTSISIPNGVTTIGKNAFNNCTGLTSAYIGSSVASFGTSPFYGCTALTDVTINSNAIASKTYSSSSRLSNIFGTQVTNYTFGDSVTAIGDYACYNLTGLKSVVFGDSIASLGQYAFDGCTGLTSIELPENMTSIGRGTFGGCTGLTEITIGKEMNTIFDDAFYDCSNMQSVTINSNALASQTYSEEYTLADLFGDQVTHYTFGDDVKAIGAYACNDLTNLTSVKFGESLLYIGEHAFNGCTGLTKAEYANIESVCNMQYEQYTASPLYSAHHLFINGEEVTEVAIPETVSTIEWCAFGGCTGLTSVTIPNNVTKIEGWAFHGCSSLSNVEIPNSVTYLGKGALAECANLKSVSLSENLDSIAYATFASCSSLTSIIIPEGVHSIGQQAFQLCRKLTNISIPDSVSFIDYGAFANSGLTSVSIPKSVKSLGAAVFFSCPDLKTLVVYSDGLSMNSSIFAYCSSLNEIVSTGRLNMTVPDSSTVLVPSALVTDMQAKYQNATVLALETTDATQTTLSLSSATEHFKVLGATMDGTEVQVNEGVVKLTGCTPANSYTVNIDGEAFGLPVYIPLAVMTDSIALAINAKDATNTTLTVQGSYDAGDANVTFAGFDGYEAGNEATVTGLKPGEATSFTYRVKTEDGSEFTITQDVATKPVTIASETISKTATSIVLKGKLEDLIDVEVESMGFEDSDYESDELTLTGLTPNTTYSRHFKVTLADGGEVEADIEFTTEELSLTTQLPKVVSEGNVILTALSNLDDSETNIGFEWRRQDWSDDFNSKFADAHLYGGIMEGYVSNMNIMFLWKYRPYYTAADGTTYYGDWKGIDPTDYSHFDPTVHTYATTSVDGNSVVVSGYAQRGSDDITSQGFKYWNGADAMPADAMTAESSGTVMTATLTGLATGTTYSYVAYVTTSAGETFYGEQQTFMAGEDDTTIMLLTEDDETADGIEAIYDLSGRRIAKMQRGVNIVRYTDGSTRKVRMK